MESNLSQLSSLSDDGNQLYIQPHYKETYRLAIYALLCGGREAYEEFLRAEQISNFLSEQEIHFIQENAELPAEEDECEAKRPREAGNPSTYFPLESDEEVPDLELGWPEVSPDAADTSISLLFNPPRVDTPTIKEVIRKQIQEARQVRAENKITLCTWHLVGAHTASNMAHLHPCQFTKRSETYASPTVGDKRPVIRLLLCVVCFPVVALWPLDKHANHPFMQNVPDSVSKRLIAVKKTWLCVDDIISNIQ